MIVVRPNASPARRACLLVGALLVAICLVAVSPVTPALAQDVDGDLPPDVAPGEANSPDGEQVLDWSPILWKWAQRPARSQVELRRAEISFASGDRAQALVQVEEATQLDPLNSRAWYLRGRIHLMSGDPLFVQDLLFGARSLLSSYPDQSRWASRFLLNLDLVLGLALCWFIVVLLIRYLPFFHHQIRALTQGDGHTDGRGLLLWIPALAPLCLGLGVIPSLCAGILIVWLYTGKRERFLLAIFVLVLAAQGPWAGRLATPLTGVDTESVPSLVQRAAREAPGPALKEDLRTAAEQRPDSPTLAFAQGLVAAREGNFARSTARFQDVLRLDPDDAMATNNLANNHYYNGDYDRAVAGYQRSASLDPLEGSTNYNLAQAYIKKLFFKEGGEHMQRASRAGFELGDPAHRLPTGAVYYQAPDPMSAWKLAWDEPQPVVMPFDFLAPLGAWMGVPADHISIWLLATLILALLLLKLLPREKLVFECANCGILSCPSCSGEHDGNVLCHGCHHTTQRARSEVVLTTLLRNRRRATEFAFHTRVRALNGWFFGAGDLYNGMQRRGVFLGFLLACCVAGLLHPGVLLPSPWQTAQQFEWLSAARIMPLAGLFLIFLISRFGRSAWRSRSFHLHPASMVRLADLMDGRSEKRLKA